MWKADIFEVRLAPRDRMPRLLRRRGEAAALVVDAVVLLDQY